MQSIRYVHWQAGDAWLGHLEEYPDSLTQGELLSDLEEHLRYLHKDLVGFVSSTPTPFVFPRKNGCPTWIRTMTKASKGPCATVTPSDTRKLS
jgi:hypothetical protein